MQQTVGGRGSGLSPFGSSPPGSLPGSLPGSEPGSEPPLPEPRQSARWNRVASMKSVIRILGGAADVVVLLYTQSVSEVD